jgi:hypothetical protein
MLRPEENDLLRRAAQWPAHPRCADLTAAALAEIAHAHGIDFATAVLHDRLLRSRPDGSPPVLASARPALAAAMKNRLVAVAPGAFYREHPATGADGQRVMDVAKRLGWRVVRIPLDSFGTLQKNAAILARWLRAHAHERIILVSLSKGGADVKIALAAADAETVFSPVEAWISFSGILEGTALANWLLARRVRTVLVKLLCWWRGYSFQLIQDVQRGPGHALASPLRLPRHLLAVHVLGFPLEKHLSSPLARRAFNRLAPLGPNDGGGNLLADAARWPGIVWPVWGADHYFREGSIAADDLIGNLLYFVADPDVRVAAERTGNENSTAFACR